MKAIIFTTLMIASGLANAKTVCTLNAANPKLDMVFDRALYSSEVSAPRYLVYRAGDVAASEFDLKHVSYAQLKSMNGATFVTFGPTAASTVGITLGHIDLSKSNVLPIDAVAFGEPTGQAGINLIAPKLGLSASCNLF